MAGENRRSPLSFHLYQHSVKAEGTSPYRWHKRSAMTIWVATRNQSFRPITGGKDFFMENFKEALMLDIRLIRENPDLIKKNIEAKFQHHKLELVDKLLDLDEKNRAAKTEADELRASRNQLSKEIGVLMSQGKKEEAEAVKAKVKSNADRLSELESIGESLGQQVTDILMTLPNIIDPSVPIGKDDSENVELKKFGEPVVPDFEVPYHVDIMARFDGIDLDSARKVAGNGFYYLQGDIARMQSAVLSYARDFMIDRGFTYCIPPFMIRSEVVTGVMSFAEMDAMMYKIEGEDLYLIGTSEHSMIGKFIDTILPEEKLPQTLTSYSPCFRKEKGAHGIEERGVYRIHQFEKQEMIVVCKPEESMDWFWKMLRNTIDFFRTLDVPVRSLECCSGDLADLKVKSIDVEAWSPRQQKYFEVGSCSNLGEAQARRLKIRADGEKGKYFPHTLNNTVTAPPRMLIALLENNLQADGSVLVPKALQPYMGGKEKLVPIA
jgi:seryl-tRNA synthetase